MKKVHIKIDNEVWAAMQEILSHQKISRDRYINRAILSYNSIQERKLLAEQLRKESLNVRKDSMEVLTEFESLDLTTDNFSETRCE